MNLPSGESMVRQLVHGQRFFEENFGRRYREVWIPDVFGYPASLPQLLAAGGCTRSSRRSYRGTRRTAPPTARSGGGHRRTRV